MTSDCDHMRASRQIVQRHLPQIPDPQSGCFKLISVWIVYYRAVRTRTMGIVVGPDLQLRNMETSKVSPLAMVKVLINSRTGILGLAHCETCAVHLSAVTVLLSGSGLCNSVMGMIQGSWLVDPVLGWDPRWRAPVPGSYWD